MTRPIGKISSDPNALHAWEDFIEEQVYPDARHEGQGGLSQLRQPRARHGARVLQAEPPPARRSNSSARSATAYLGLNRRRMSIFDALDYLNTLVDDSDPDIELDQLQHLLQTSEAIRADGHEDWFVLTGLVHDLGKVLCLYGEPQWAVVGDTFPVGCRFDERIVYHEFFAQNPDATRFAVQHAAGRLRTRIAACEMC